MLRSVARQVVVRTSRLRTSRAFGTSFHLCARIDTRKSNLDAREHVPGHDNDLFGTLDPRFMDSKSRETERVPPSEKRFPGATWRIPRRETGVDKSIGFYQDKRVGSKNSQAPGLEPVSRRNEPPSLQERTQSGSVDEASDTFGTLMGSNEFSKQYGHALDDGGPEEEADDDGHIRLSKYGRKHEQAWYVHRLNKMAARGQVFEAVEMLHKEMIEKDRVLPNSAVYTIVITALAKAGYTKLAFKLFREMRDRGLKSPPHIFTALYNACANCENKNEGLRRALALREYMHRKQIRTQAITYKAAIKAFAMSGEVQAAFSLLDEAMVEGLRLDTESISMVLMACIADKDAGFRRAIQVWRVMLSRRLVPDLHQYNLLVRCLKDCSIGESGKFAKILTTSLPTMVTPEPKKLSASRENLALVDTAPGLIHAPIISNVDVQLPSSSTVSAPSIPDVLSPLPVLENVVGICGNITTAADRLALLGGVDGLLLRMRGDNVTPDIKTFSMLVDVIESNSEAESNLVDVMASYKVKPDTPFCNLIMRKRVFRQDIPGAKDVVDIMGRHQLMPDLHTYATLALTCKSKNEAAALLRAIEAQGVEPTIEIFTHLNQAAFLNFSYRRWLCDQLDERAVLPDQRFIRQCEARISQARKLLVSLDASGNEDDHKSRIFRGHFQRFNVFYKPWLMRTKLAVPKHEPKKFDDLKRAVEPVRLQLQSSNDDDDETL